MDCEMRRAPSSINDRLVPDGCLPYSDHTGACMQDYWHHWEDVTVGFLLGLGTAYLYFRVHYHGLSGPQAGEPMLPSLLGNGGEGQTARTRYQDLEAAPSFSEAQY